MFRPQSSKKSKSKPKTSFENLNTLEDHKLLTFKYAFKNRRPKTIEEGDNNIKIKKKLELPPLKKK